MENNFYNVSVYGQYINADIELSSDKCARKNYFWTILKRFI